MLSVCFAGIMIDYYTLSGCAVNSFWWSLVGKSNMFINSTEKQDQRTKDVLHIVGCVSVMLHSHSMKTDKNTVDIVTGQQCKLQCFRHTSVSCDNSFIVNRKHFFTLSEGFFLNKILTTRINTTKFALSSLYVRPMATSGIVQQNMPASDYSGQYVITERIAIHDGPSSLWCPKSSC